MNKEKKSAGYFDKNRQKPIFTGDIYKEEGAMLPYHRVEEKIDKSGFSIWHVGTNDRFDFSANAKNLIENEYIGNVYDDKTLWDKIKPYADEDTEENEVIDNADDSEDTVDTTDTADVQFDTVDTVDEDVSAVEEQEEETEETEEVKDITPMASADATTGKDTPVQVEKDKREVYLRDRIKAYTESIDKLKAKNEELETEAKKMDVVTETLQSQSFQSLKTLVFQAIAENAKKFNAKECDKLVKKCKTINDLEELLTEYADIAERNRNNIENNNNKISDYDDKIASLKDDLEEYTSQQHLDLIHNK